MQSMRMISFISLVLFVLGMTKAQVNTSDVEAANTAFTKGEWQKAVGAYQSLAKAEPLNTTYWYRLGYANYSLKEYQKAITAFERAQTLQSNPSTMYDIACSYSLLNRKKEALDWLEKAAVAGFTQIGLLTSDADLANVRSEPRFSEISARVQKNATPCADDPLHRQLDFWVGEWDVHNEKGEDVGKSHIQRILGGCVILEEWTGARGYTGKSFNFVDPVSGKWRQTWVDDRGGKIEFTGSLEGKDMIYFADANEGGKEFRRRLTFFNLGPDRVRQFSERTYDGGTTWHTEYDFVYDRKK